MAPAIKPVSDLIYDYGSTGTIGVGAVLAATDLPNSYKAAIVVILAIITLVGKWHSNATDPKPPQA